MSLAGFPACRVISLPDTRNTSLRGIADGGPAALRSVQIFRLVLLIQVVIEKKDTAVPPAGVIVPSWGSVRLDFLLQEG